jgi:hypothetical protein
VTELGNDSFGREVRSRYGDQNFEFSKPIAVNSEEAAEKEDSLPSELNINEDLATFINEKIKENSAFLDNLTHYGHKKITG